MKWLLFRTETCEKEIWMQLFKIVMVFFLQVYIYSRTEACEKDILNQIFQIVEVILNRYVYILPWSMHPIG